jgi:hypothetical protein
MNPIAGLASLRHPLVGAGRAPGGPGGFAIVKHSSPSPAPRDYYALAARWCGLGAFLPLSWREPVEAATISALGPESAARAREAIEQASGQIELAFAITRVGASAEAEGAPGTSGRAYLRALRSEHETCRGFVDRLRARASECGFAVSLIANAREGTTGLVRCRRENALAVGLAVEGMAGAISGVSLTLSEPLPPFGAGAELVERLGLSRARRAA